MKRSLLQKRHSEMHEDIVSCALLVRWERNIFYKLKEQKATQTERINILSNELTIRWDAAGDRIISLNQLFGKKLQRIFHEIFHNETKQPFVQIRH